MALTAGTRLGPYEVLGPLGAGGMGEVCRARDTRLGREVALKILPADHASDPGRVRRFEHEARAVAALNHPNILALYDTGAEGGVTYAVFEILEGQTFRGLLQKGPVAPAKVVDCGVQVCRGLAAAHEKGIIHRDLKPENLFLTKDGIVKILDFGLARLVRPLEGQRTTAASQGTSPGLVLGTAGYMSPEQVRGEPADHRSDLFSLGAVLYEMLSGQRAFRGTSSVETLNAILKEEPAEIAPERKIPPAVERLVRHCLEKSPDDRVQSARDLAFELGGVAPTTGTGTPVTTRGPARRSHPWLAAGIVALATGVVLGAGAFLGRHTLTTVGPTYKQITFRRGFPASGRFTPDGRTVIYAASWDDAPGTEIYSVRLDAPESKPLGLPPAQVVGVSSRGELAVLLPPSDDLNLSAVYPAGGVCGTLARVPLSGGTPRPVAENVLCADWASDGERLAALRSVGGAKQIEFPLGKVLARTSTEEPLLGCPRVSLRGDRLAFGTTDGFRVIDLGSGRSSSITGIPQWGHVAWWAWSADGEEIWFSASDSIEMPLEAVSLTGRRRVLARVAGHLRLLDVARSGQVLLEHGISRTSAFARTAGDAQGHEITVFDNATVLGLSADGKRALLFERGPATGLRQFVYLTRTDGSEAVRLAEEGAPWSLSPDGQQVLVGPAAYAYETPSWSGVRIVPVGAGDVRAVQPPGLDLAGALWTLDGRSLLALGREQDRPLRVFLLDPHGSGRRAVTPEGVSNCAPGEHRIACVTPTRGVVVYPLDGGAPREVRGLTLEPGLSLLRMSEDEASMIVAAKRHTRTAPFRLERIDLASGRRSLLREFGLADAAGAWAPYDPVVTPDGRSYAYSVFQYLQHLYLADGLR